MIREEIFFVVIARILIPVVSEISGNRSMATSLFFLCGWRQNLDIAKPGGGKVEGSQCQPHDERVRIQKRPLPSRQITSVRLRFPLPISRVDCSHHTLARYLLVRGWS